jgi:hypothetical protein
VHRTKKGTRGNTIAPRLEPYVLPTTILGLRIRCVQELLKMVYELCYMQAVCQPMVHVDRYRHGAAASRLRDFAEGDSRRRIFTGEVSRM